MVGNRINRDKVIFGFTSKEGLNLKLNFGLYKFYKDINIIFLYFWGKYLLLLITFFIR